MKTDRKDVLLLSLSCEHTARRKLSISERGLSLETDIRF